MRLERVVLFAPNHKMKTPKGLSEVCSISISSAPVLEPSRLGLDPHSPHAVHVHRPHLSASPASSAACFASATMCGPHRFTTCYLPGVMASLTISRLQRSANSQDTESSFPSGCQQGQVTGPRNVGLLTPHGGNLELVRQ